MFSIFKKEPTESESINYCRLLANRAFIDLTYVQGDPKFIIKVDQVGATIAPYMKQRKAIAAFVEIVEDRIFREFPANQAEDLGLPAELMDESETNFNGCYRVVGSSEMKGLFKWRFTGNSELLIENI